MPNFIDVMNRLTSIYDEVTCLREDVDKIMDKLNIIADEVDDGDEE